MLYLCNPSTDAVVAQMRRGALGFIDTPAQRQKRPGVALWCADNGVFGKGFPGEQAWFAWLQRQAAKRDAALCLFAVAPDVVGDHEATLKRSRPWLQPIRELNIPAAFVAQDGMTVDGFDEWELFDVLFIGGTDAFKLGDEAVALIREAKTRGKRVHMGRVNSRKRMRYCVALDVDTSDGTLIANGPDKHLPSVLKWLGEAHDDTAVLRSVAGMTDARSLMRFCGRLSRQRGTVFT